MSPWSHPSNTNDKLSRAGPRYDKFPAAWMPLGLGTKNLLTTVLTPFQVFCELLCGNLWDPNDLEYDLCMEGCVNVAAEPGVPVDLGDIEFGSGKA